MGETLDEIREVMQDLRGVGCDIVTIGQYLQPTRHHLPVARFYTPEEFSALKEEGLALGFNHVESGPLVRSSYHAEQQTAIGPT
jgi:lipoic acid synthetase